MEFLHNYAPLSSSFVRSSYGLQKHMQIRLLRGDQRGDPRIMWSVKHQDGPTLPGITTVISYEYKSQMVNARLRGKNTIVRYINAVREAVEICGIDRTGNPILFHKLLMFVARDGYFRSRNTKRV